MGSYASAVWRCRYFWLSLVRSDLRSRYRGSVIGLGWSLLHPILMTVILCGVFHKLFRLDVAEYGPYLLSGLAFWTFLVSTAQQGCKCFFQAEPYIRQFPAPLAIYPLRAALGGTVHFLLALGIVLSLSWMTNGFGNLSALASLLPTLVLVFLLCCSLAVLAGFANVLFQDTQHIVDIVFQIMFYATPIIYPLRTLREIELEWLITWNPLVPFLRLVREPILDGRVPALETFTAASFFVFLTAGAATLALARLQRKLVFYL